jgi:hypothetical protein
MSAFGYKGPDSEEPSNDEASKDGLDLRDTTVLSVNRIFLDKDSRNISEQHLEVAVSHVRNGRGLG